MYPPSTSVKSSNLVRTAEILAAVLTVGSILCSATLFYTERTSRKRAVLFSAWSIVAATEEKRVDAGRSDALRQLMENRQSLAGIVLNGGIFRNVDLSNNDLSLASLKNVEFMHCRLKNVNLSGASLDGGHFRENCDFRDAKFERTRLHNTILADSSLERAQFLGAEGNALTSFNGAVMRGGVISNAEFGNVMFDNADLTGLTMVMSRIEKATFLRATLTGSRFSGVKAAGAQFQRATGERCLFGWGSILDGAAFDRVAFYLTTFEDSSLRGAHFFGATLNGGRFVSCDLTGADFTSALLTQTTFDNCIIQGALFRNAELGSETRFVGCVGTPIDLVEVQGDARR